MNLPKGYANLNVLSTFLQEHRDRTIQRVNDGEFKTARPYVNGKWKHWIIRQDELFEIMTKHRQDVPTLTGKINLCITGDHLGTDLKEAETRLLEILSEMEASYGHMLDEDETTYWIEES